MYVCVLTVGANINIIIIFPGLRRVLLRILLRTLLRIRLLDQPAAQRRAHPVIHHHNLVNNQRLAHPRRRSRSRARATSAVEPLLVSSSGFLQVWASQLAGISIIRISQPRELPLLVRKTTLLAMASRMMTTSKAIEIGG
jgi:hypothetical protein